MYFIMDRISKSKVVLIHHDFCWNLNLMWDSLFSGHLEGKSCCCRQLFERCLMMRWRDEVIEEFE